MLPPAASTISTASALNSGVNFRRPLVLTTDSLRARRRNHQVSVKAGQLQGTSFTCLAFTSFRSNPRSSSTYQIGFQYGPVASMTTSTTPLTLSQSASSSRLDVMFGLDGALTAARTTHAALEVEKRLGADFGHSRLHS